MYLTQQVRVKKTAELRDLCHCTKELYNYCNRLVQECLQWISPEGNPYWIRDGELRRLIHRRAVFRALLSAVAAAVVRHVDKNWKIYFISMRNWENNPEKFRSQPKPPHFLEKSEELFAKFDYNSFTVKSDGTIRFAKNVIPPVRPPRKIAEMLALHLTEVYANTRRGSLQEVRVVPRDLH